MAAMWSANIFHWFVMHALTCTCNLGASKFMAFSRTCVRVPCPRIWCHNKNTYGWVKVFDTIVLYITEGHKIKYNEVDICRAFLGNGETPVYKELTIRFLPRRRVVISSCFATRGNGMGSWVSQTFVSFPRNVPIFWWLYTPQNLVKVCSG